MFTLPQLEEKIYSLVPELKELTFGCEVKIKLYGRCKFCGEAYKKIFFYTEENTVLSLSPVDLLDKQKIEIIGHEIRPEHWLPLLGGDYAIDGNGKIMEHGWSDAYPCSGFFGGCSQYDFKKSFSEQSPEFHEWLLSQLP